MTAEDLANEVEATRKTVTIGAGDNAVTLTVPEKWKRFKYLRCINSGDTVGALEAAFGPEQVVLLEDIDVDRNEFDSILDKLVQALSGTSVGN